MSGEIPCTVYAVVFNGGGARGVYQAAFCAALEQELKRSMVNTFHVFAGVSIGALNATNFAMAGLPPKMRAQPKTPRQAVRSYPVDAPQIFKANKFRTLASLMGLHDELYDSRAFNRILASNFGLARLSDVQGSHLLLGAYDNHERTIKLYNNIYAGAVSAPADKQLCTEDPYLAEVVRDSCNLAPLFRERVRRGAEGKPNIREDGGCYSINITPLVFRKIQALYPGADHYTVISVGTGRDVSSKTSPSKGVLAGLSSTLDRTIDSGDQIAHEHMLDRQRDLGKDKLTYLRFDFDGEGVPDRVLRPDTSGHNGDPEVMLQRIDWVQHCIQAQQSKFDDIVRALRSPRCSLENLRQAPEVRQVLEVPTDSVLQDTVIVQPGKPSQPHYRA